ncbi:hypothetical protein AW093_25015 [Escherichia coli]|nr:hypothetical protein AW093_25015 [Escherichia coli]
MKIIFFRYKNVGVYGRFLGGSRDEKCSPLPSDTPFIYIICMKWHTEFGHLNRGDMLTSEQHRCSNEKKKFQRRV